MTTSRIPAVVEGLVTMVTTAVGTSAKVYDGRFVTTPDGDYVTVGWTPDDEGSTSRQRWGPSGNRARDEEIDVPCYIDSYSGSTDTASRRNAAFAILGLVETALRSDPTIGGAVPRNLPAEISEIRERIEQTEKGLAVGLVFHVLTPRARI